jgi:hypothetical protein
MRVREWKDDPGSMISRCCDSEGNLTYFIERNMPVCSLAFVGNVYLAYLFRSRPRIDRPLPLAEFLPRTIRTPDTDLWHCRRECVPAEDYNQSDPLLTLTRYRRAKKNACT